MFDSMVKSLKAFRREGGLNAAPASSDLFKNSHIPSGISGETVFGGVQGANDEKPTKKASPFDDPMIFYGGIALVVLVGITLVKKLKKK